MRERERLVFVTFRVQLSIQSSEETFQGPLSHYSHVEARAHASPCPSTL